MRIIRTLQGLRAWRDRQPGHVPSIGFVPTMGSLHDGHVSLITRAKNMSKTVVVSIFVNPLQFGPLEDFAQYPRNLTEDLTLCRKQGVDVVFIPRQKELYPTDFQTTVRVATVSSRWEGEHRPTHFQGVTTVVAKLLNLVRPTRTFLGQKDYQQFLVIRQMVRDLHFGTKVVLCPTIREKDGLALSSRNQYLIPSQRPLALCLYQALRKGYQQIVRGQRKGRVVKRTMETYLQHHPSLTVDYVACCDAKTLEPLTHIRGATVLLGAIRLEGIRLIDNILVKVRH